MAFVHPYHFDPAYGHDLEALKAVVPPAPFPEFKSFWEETYQQAQAIPLEFRYTPSADVCPGHCVYDVTFRSWGGRTIGGWLVVPTDEVPRAAIVQGHGYGGRAAPGPVLGMAGLPAVQLFFSARGFHPSAAADIPDSSPFHVIHGIEDREEYVIRGCVVDVWAATRALLEFAPELADRLYYSGGSFGGGLGALALPWEPRLKKAFLGVPTFGNHPYRVHVECVGSGQAVRLLHRRKPEVLEVLKYYDAAIAASWITTPTLVGCAAFDPAVPPPGQFAVYNAIAGRKELFVSPAGHFEYPEAVAVETALQERLRCWFTE